MTAAQPFDLNGAVSAFSITLVRDQITQLKNEYEKELELDAVQIRDLLRQVDQKRLRFYGDKQRLLNDLRTTLSSIQADSDTIDATTSELDKLTPAWLAIIPAAASLARQPPTPAAPTPSFSGTDAQDATVGTDEPGSKRLQEETETDERPEKKAKFGSCEVRHLSSAHSGSRAFQLVQDEDGTGAAEPGIPRKLCMSELDRIECVFTHSEKEGFWVVRCPADDCTLRISDRSPFENRSAFNHFNSRHLRQTETEESIFNQYAYEVEDATVDAVASRYDGGDIPECTPSREIPVSTPGSIALPPPRKARRSAVEMLLDATTSESESENTPDNSHHNLRQRPKPSYVSISKGRMSSVSDDLSQTEGSKSLRIKPTGPRKSKSSGLYKPFGHTGEWPRRSAPA